MTRTHKANDVPHQHPEAEPLFQEHQIPKYFGKTGPVDQDPHKVKKNGGGRGNWGPDGLEAEDLDEFRMAKPRRRSNSMSHVDKVITKFEVKDDDPEFEEDAGAEMVDGPERAQKERA